MILLFYCNICMWSVMVRSVSVACQCFSGQFLLICGAFAVLYCVHVYVLHICCTCNNKMLNGLKFTQANLLPKTGLNSMKLFCYLEIS